MRDFKIYRQLFERLASCLAGISTYIVVGELALSRRLVGSVTKLSYLPLICEIASHFWHESALLSLQYAEDAYAPCEDIIGGSGSLSRAIM